MTEYTTGFNFSSIQKSFDNLLATAGTCTGCGSKLPSLEICQNGCGVLGFARSVR